ncbi:MAG: RNA-splicing ligase RtcB [Chitinivibrionales bacterium]|nr:RNA-splicing ligase RtcB [Chitinivibrionales bacterium]MBD3355793.1 RNA-splicing ligase RtcB [Chitinivibrionales bacterium]
MTRPSGIERIEEAVWELGPSYKPGMLVPARIFATEKLLDAMDQGVFDQVTNIARLPGIVRYACCMPDGHWGYGFPIGGVAAMDARDGVISPGGIGFDINCGMRLAMTSLTYDEVKPKLERLVDRLFSAIPTGVGGKGVLSLSKSAFGDLMTEGAAWCVKNGHGWKEDLERTEENGKFPGADPSKVSVKAIERGFHQVGSLGSGNHYLEIQVAHPNFIYDQERAKAFGITMPHQVAVMLHCGSRGLGHQIATDYLQRFIKVMGPKYGISVPDRELACAPLHSPEGEDYFAAMTCAINMAFANRQAILHRVREVFSDVFGKDPAELGMHQVYDVTHNTAKIERHPVNGKERELVVHRKGATRAFGPGMKGVPERYAKWGQPVIIGGSMETGSYLLAGTATAEKTFFSTTHGSGRVMSRHQAKKRFEARQLLSGMRARGIYTRTASYRGLAEEAGGAYKDIDEVIGAAKAAGLSIPVVRFVPIGNIKG